MRDIQQFSGSGEREDMYEHLFYERVVGWSTLQALKWALQGKCHDLNEKKWAKLGSSRAIRQQVSFRCGTLFSFAAFPMYLTSLHH